MDVFCFSPEKFRVGIALFSHSYRTLLFGLFFSFCLNQSIMDLKRSMNLPKCARYEWASSKVSGHEVVFGSSFISQFFESLIVNCLHILFMIVTRLGCRIPSARCNINALLDRDSSPRTASVVRQGKISYNLIQFNSITVINFHYHYQCTMVQNSLMLGHLIIHFP